MSGAETKGLIAVMVVGSFFEWWKMARKYGTVKGNSTARVVVMGKYRMLEDEKWDSLNNSSNEPKKNTSRTARSKIEELIRILKTVIKPLRNAKRLMRNIIKTTI